MIVTDSNRLGDLAMDVTAQLGAFAAALKYGDIPPDVRERCRMSVLDAIGIMLGAADFARHEGDRCLKNYLEAAAPPGNATVFGHAIRTTALMAAFANGTQMEVLDYQDSNVEASMHSGTPILPPALALAETHPLTWAALVAAIIAGYEVHTRLLLGIQMSHWYKGFQGTGTFGTCGAATTAARLLGLDAGGITAALGISGFVMPVSNGDNQFKGYNVKPVHGGQAAMCGLSSAYMAQAGYRGGPLEGEPPRHHAVLHILSDGPNLERIVAGLNEIWYTRDVYYKPYPVGGLFIGVIELILALRAEHRIKADDVASVDIITYKHAVVFTGKKYTNTDSNYVDAHLSIPYCVAAALYDGEMTTRQLFRERLRDTKLHQLASRVTVSEDLDMTKAFPYEWPAKVAIRMQDGATLERRVDRVKWSPRLIPTWEELSQKFRLVADPVIGPGRARQAVEIVAELKEGSTLASLIETVQLQ
jgi:2-methylcitrate dehydratase PrpD